MKKIKAFTAKVVALTILIAGLVSLAIVVDYALVKKLEPNNIGGVTPEIESLFSGQFIMIGDTGTGLKRQYDVASSIKAECDKAQNCKAVFIAGDVIYDKGVTSVNDIQFKQKFEDPYHDIALPFYIAYGNHDYAGCKECYLGYNKLSEKWEMPASYYTQTFENEAGFFIIDTENFDKTQQNWLKEALQKDQAPFKVVVGHRPLETYEKTKIGEEWSGMNELQAIICDQVEYYVAGHAHVLEDNGSIGSCSVRQLVSGSAGAFPRTVQQPHPGNFAYEESGFLTMDLKDKQVKATFFNDQGVELYQHSQRYQ